MILKSLVLNALLLSVCTFAKGTKDSGGDPLAREFVGKGLKVSMFLMENPRDDRFTFDVKAFEELAKKYDQSIKDEEAPDLIEIVEKKPVDSFGVEKAAITNEESGKIKVHHQTWLSLNEKQRLTLVVMEYFVLLKVPNRYEEAEKLVERAEGYARNANENVYSHPSLRNGIAKSVIDFKFNSEDIIIDAGVMLTGTPENLAGIAFLQNPSSQSKWLEKLFEGLKNNKIVYFVYRSPDLIANAIVGYDVNLRGGQIVLQRNVKLLKSNLKDDVAKAGGDCDFNDKSLTFADRVATCFHNEAFESIETDQYKDNDLYNEMTFGLTREENLIALSNLNIQTYEAMLYYLALDSIKSYRKIWISLAPDPQVGSDIYNDIPLGAPFAYGYRPTLTANHFDVEQLVPPFWIKTENIDLADRRLNEAALYLKKNEMTFLDSTTSCQHYETGELVKGPAIMSIAKVQKSRCTSFHVVPPPLREEMMIAMTAAGFVFNEKLLKWVKGDIVVNVDNPEFEITKTKLNPLIEYQKFKIMGAADWGNDSKKAHSSYSSAHIKYLGIPASDAQKVSLHLKQLEGESLEFQARYLTFLFWDQDSKFSEKYMAVKIDNPEMIQIYVKANEILEQILVLGEAFSLKEDFYQALAWTLRTLPSSESALANEILINLLQVSQEKAWLKELLDVATKVHHSLDVESSHFTPAMLETLVEKINPENLDERAYMILNPEYTGDRPKWRDEKSELLRAKLLEVLVRSGHLSAGASALVQKHIDLFTVRSLWRSKMITSADQNSRKKLMNEGLKENPSVVAPLILEYVQTEKDLNPLDKEEWIKKIIETLSNQPFSELKFQYETVSDSSVDKNRSYTYKLGLLVDLQSYLFQGFQFLTKETQLALEKFLFAKYSEVKGQEKLSFAKNIVEMLSIPRPIYYQGDIKPNDFMIALELLEEVNNSLLENNAESHALVDLVLKHMECYKRRGRNEGSTNYGFCWAIKDPQKINEIFAKNPKIPMELRMKFGFVIE